MSEIPYNDLEQQKNILLKEKNKQPVIADDFSNILNSSTNNLKD